MAKGPYSRVYHELADDYPEVYDTPLLADFLRLLVAAEQAYPTRAKWVGHTTSRAIARLAAIGADDERGALVILDGQRYSMKGLDSERGRRMLKASNAARSRWANDPSSGSNAQSNASGNAHGNAHVPYRRDETSKDETSKSKEARATFDSRDGLPSLTPDAVAEVEAATEMILSTASDKVLADLDGLVGRHGAKRVAQTIGHLKGERAMTWPQLVYGAVRVLEPIPGANGKAERDAAAADEARKRSDDEYRRTQERIKADPLYRHLGGKP